MTTDKKKYLDTIEALTDALGRSDGQSIQEVREDLGEYGIDVDGALERLMNARMQISMQAKRSVLDRSKQKRLSLKERGNEFVGRFNYWSKEQIINRIKELCGSEAGLAYRDLESMGRDEMATMLEDLELANARNQEDASNEE